MTAAPLRCSCSRRWIFWTSGDLDKSARNILHVTQASLSFFDGFFEFDHTSLSCFKGTSQGRCLFYLKGVKRKVTAVIIGEKSPR